MTSPALAWTAARLVAVVPPMPTAWRGDGELSLWLSGPLFVALLVLAVWIRRR